MAFPNKSEHLEVYCKVIRKIGPWKTFKSFWLVFCKFQQKTNTRVHRNKLLVSPMSPRMNNKAIIISNFLLKKKRPLLEYYEKYEQNFPSKKHASQAWWHRPIILATGRQRKEDQQFEANLGYLLGVVIYSCLYSQYLAS